MDATRINPFDTVKKLFKGEEEVHVDSPYMVNRILSFLPETFDLSLSMNRLNTRLPEWAVDLCYNICVPKKRTKVYLRYAKRAKVKDKKLRRKICQTFYVNERHANEIIKLVKDIGGKPETYFGLKEGE